MKNLESISKLLDNRSKSRLARPIQASIILNKFRQVCNDHLSPMISKNITLISFNKKAIKIKCSNASIAQEMKFKERFLIDKINENLGKKVAEKLQIIFQ